MSSKIVFCFAFICGIVASNAIHFNLPSGTDILLRARHLVEQFTCDDRKYGYYADTDNECAIFHVCVPVNDDDGTLVTTGQFSFVCGNGTMFNQASLTCTLPEDSTPCEQAMTLYDSSNANFGILGTNVTVHDLATAVKQKVIDSSFDLDTPNSGDYVA